jgi:hypothetical protein
MTDFVCSVGIAHELATPPPQDPLKAAKEYHF